MEENFLEYVREKMKNDFDVKYREVHTTLGVITIVYIDNLCDSKFISEYIIAPLNNNVIEEFTVKSIRDKVIAANTLGDITKKEEVVLHILSGDAVLILPSSESALYCEAKGFPRRAINIPITENVIRGPREGFTETAVDNISLIRRKIKNADLKFESLSIGEKSNTVVVLAYLENTAPKELVDRIRGNLNKKINFILDSNYITEQISDKKTSFDTVGYSEKPDIVASKLLEGRIAIVVDGTPFVITAPYFFLENFQMPDDYYLNKYFTNFSRALRWMAFIISTLLPGLYLAITTYHFSLIPSVFVFRLAVSRAGVPFPTVIEIILMMFFFQILREAGIRLPQPIGQAMSIVGALILGDAAVGAGLTSQTTMIVVALSSISSFLIPKLYGAITCWSIIVLLFASFLGLPGFYIGFFMMLSHVSGLTTCGYPYTYPLSTKTTYGFKDTIFRRDLDKTSKNIFKKDDSI